MHISFRPGCFDCTRKHLSQAIAMFYHASGHPLNLWMAAGHLMEAYSEILIYNDEVANKIKRIICWDNMDNKGLMNVMLAQACILGGESHMGYPTHRWLAVGYLANISDIIIFEDPDRAHKLREDRLKYMEDSDYIIDFKKYMYEGQPVFNRPESILSLIDFVTILYNQYKIENDSDCCTEEKNRERAVARTLVCMECPSNNNDMCLEDQESITEKVPFKESQCPLGKWSE